MKTLKIFLTATLCTVMAVPGFSQKIKTESFKVSGECGMCKKKIEKSAQQAGASYAVWDQHTKILKLTYAADIDVSNIQQRIAEAGYDTPKFRATDAAYSSLDKCCQYARETEKKSASCCSSEECKMKDGACTDMAVCKEKNCCKDAADCSKRGCCEKTGTDDKNGAGEKQ
jgi:mercuric ion binding protein